MPSQGEYDEISYLVFTDIAALRYFECRYPKQNLNDCKCIVSSSSHHNRFSDVAQGSNQ